MKLMHLFGINPMKIPTQRQGLGLCTLEIFI
jgi:hypothetical protein